MVSRVGLCCKRDRPKRNKAKLNSQAVAGETVFILLESRMERKRTVPYSAPPFLAVRLEFLYTDWQRIGPLVDMPNFDHKASEPVVELVHISFSSNFSGHFSVATQEKNDIPILYIFIILPVEYDSNFIK